MSAIKVAVSFLAASIIAAYSAPASARYVESDPIGQAAGPSTYSYALGNPLIYSDPFGLDVTMTCRPLANRLFSNFSHCSAFVWHWVQKCGNRYKVIDGQFSLPGGATSFTRDPTNQTFRDDTTAFYNPGGGNGNYDIAPPPGMTQQQFDANVIAAGNNYSQGPYSYYPGPNSNTAATMVIYQGGNGQVIVPTVPSAIGQGYYFTPPHP